MQIIVHNIGAIISTIVGIVVVIFLLYLFVWRKSRESEASKYEFITVIAHKFRTPLTESKWAVNELLNEEKDEKKIIDLKHIQQSNEKLFGLTSALMDLANTERITERSYGSEKVSLNDIVRETAASFSARFEEKSVSLSVEYPPDDIMTFVNREGISFAVQTLLENAYNYTPNGGRVSIALARSGRKATIQVSDTGIGIKQEELSKIFSGFYRTKKARATDTGGFGIGLSLSYSIIKRHGGTIKVSSEGENKGSTFVIVLPIK